MDPDAVAALGAGEGEGAEAGGTGDTGRIAHDGRTDPWMVDFASTANPRVPRGAARVYEAAFAAARQYPADDYCDTDYRDGYQEACQKYHLTAVVCLFFFAHPSVFVLFFRFHF